MAIEVRSSNIVVRNVDFDSQGYRKLRYIYSEWDAVCHKYINPIYCCIENDLYFPLGVGTKLLSQYFPEKPIYDMRNRLDKSKIRKLDFEMRHSPRDSKQTRAINFIVSATTDNFNKERMVVLNTGAGKTFVMLSALSQIGVVPIIIMNDTSLIEQWKQRIMEHTTLEEQDIRILLGKPAVDSAVKEAESGGGSKLYLASHQTLRNIINSDQRELARVFEKLGIGVKVFDECHTEMKNMSWINALTSVEYTFYLTATPFRSGMVENKIYKNLFYHTKQYIDKDMEFKFVDTYLYAIDTHPTMEDMRTVVTKRGFNTSTWGATVGRQYKDSLITLIERFIKTLDKSGPKKMVFVFPTNEFLEAANAALKPNHPDCDLFIGSVKKADRADILSNSRIILTNSKIFNKGLDVTDIECIINFCQMSSRVVTEQVFGRMRYSKDKQCHVYIDIADYGYSESKAFQGIRRKFYRETSRSVNDHTNIVYKM